MFGGIVKGITNAVSGAVGDVVKNLDLDAETLGRVAIAAITGNPMLMAQAAIDVADGQDDRGLEMFNQAMGFNDMLGGNLFGILGGTQGGFPGSGLFDSGFGQSGYGYDSGYDGGSSYQNDLRCCCQSSDPHVRDGFSSLYDWNQLANGNGYWARA